MPIRIARARVRPFPSSVTEKRNWSILKVGVERRLEIKVIVRRASLCRDLRLLISHLLQLDELDKYKFSAKRVGGLEIFAELPGWSEDIRITADIVISLVVCVR